MVEKVILFNSPANSGKDFAVEYLSKQYRVFPFSFKQKLIEITKDIYSLTDEDIAFFSSREQKELRQHKLIGRSWRQALIHVSEDVIKPAFGDEYFGTSAVKYIQQNSKNEIVACGDCGFVAEINPLITAFGAENMFLVRIESEGCSFDGDSRTYVDHPEIPDENYITISNHKDDTFMEELDWLYALVTRNL